MRTAEKPERNEVQITVPGVPIELVKDIDALAEADSRPRAAYIRKLLQEIVAARKAQSKKAA